MDSEAAQRDQLDQLLKTYMPDLSETRRRALIAAVPVYLWSIYGGRPEAPALKQRMPLKRPL